ncbi:hypothetical protein DPX16_8016 [Anabarilius grahami]|uniref:C-factor n=1 Tax=Anabarilius grahami TaxID=495550 RepID=A0A3N0Z4G2_ANAGA|nr:hypothetical protein DPX16_8016 [Anabarilius grahami]
MLAVKACNILITGANRGLGLEIVKQLSEDSCQKRQIYATCRDPDGPKSEEYLPYLQTAAKVSRTPGMSCNKAAVINISTLGGSLSRMPSMYEQFPVLPYCVSKAALNMLSVLAAEELKADEILCMALHPGWVKTEMGGEKLSARAFQRYSFARERGKTRSANVIKIRLHAATVQRVKASPQSSSLNTMTGETRTLQY